MGEVILEGHDELRQRNWSDPEYRAEYRRLKPRYDVVRELLQLRHSHSLTQTELAEKASTHQSRISKIESGEDDFRIGTLVAMADALDADVEIRLVRRQPREFYARAVPSFEVLAVETDLVGSWGILFDAWEIPKSTVLKVERPLFVKQT
jgi:transcriptional regulator with XRE-family HTH domain